MVAQRYFLEHGFAGTTMSGIAAALGGSKGTLWSHFPSKEALFSAVLDRATRSFQAELTQILNPCGEVTATLLRACNSLIEKLTSPDAIALHRLIVAEGGRFPEMRQIFFDLAPLRVRHMFSTFLQGAMARGQLRAADPFDAARALIALVMSGSHQQMMMGQLAQTSSAQTAADADFAVTTFLRAYAPDSAPSPAGQSA
ncbi:Transcriptional regulator, TetR family [Sphingobium indicum BiD32]|uniref:Transcriptional regulator, TetR family n=1 Tax=Sphingobium indicum BiD32 TaxID=1301087 RepID=N1MN37_9SPHN|nr:Transcriptional regulator, TetR family [Sphingobium indicum BiD32]